jgi:hypothetical protein
MTYMTSYEGWGGRVGTPTEEPKRRSARTNTHGRTLAAKSKRRQEKVLTGHRLESGLLPHGEKRTTS